MLEVPKYIQVAGIIDAPITYAWESYLQVRLVDKSPKNLQKLIQSISCEATFALDLGIGEWLLWRVLSSSNHVEAALYIEALWASTVDKRYLKIPIPDQPDDQGDPATGPIYGLEAELFSTTTNAMLNHPERSKTAAGLVSFVRYTLPDTKHFDTWLKTTISRFLEAFPYDKNNPHGMIVPRKFLNPDVLLDPNAIPGLLDEQLKEIDYTKNPFLASPAELKATGFDGEPYRVPS